MSNAAELSRLKRTLHDTAGALDDWQAACEEWREEALRQRDRADRALRLALIASYAATHDDALGKACRAEVKGFSPSTILQLRTKKAAG